MSGRDLVAGIDIGGTNVKAGIVDLATNEVLAARSFPTERSSEEAVLASIARAGDDLSRDAGRPRAAGVSIGSYVFGDGSIDGMSSRGPWKKLSTLMMPAGGLAVSSSQSEALRIMFMP